MRYWIIRHGLFGWAIYDSKRRELHSEMGRVGRYFFKRNAEKKIQSLIWQDRHPGRNHPYSDIG